MERKIVLARVVGGCAEEIEWFRHGDVVRVVAGGQGRILEPKAWRQLWAELEACGFVEVYPTDQRQMAVEKDRVLNLIRNAFRGVRLGQGIGLRQAAGLDRYADLQARLDYRAQDEKNDWMAISVEDLNRYGGSLAFVDAEGMRFHLPALLVADLEGTLTHANVLLELVMLESGRTSRFDLLTETQRQAVREFLKLRLEDAGYEYEQPRIKKALGEFWAIEGVS